MSDVLGICALFGAIAFVILGFAALIGEALWVGRKQDDE